MDEIIIGLVFLIFCLLWRFITSWACSQRCLHCLGSKTPFIQWYTITVVGLTVLLCRSFYDIVKYDWIAGKFLDSELVHNKIKYINTSLCHADGKPVVPTPGADCAPFFEELTELKITNWLRVLALGSPVCGMIAFFLLTRKLWDFVKQNADYKTQHGIPYPWMLAIRLDRVITIVGMPLIFNVMAMRALIRILAIMTGSAYRGPETMPTIASWEDRKSLELATFDNDLELALAFQFYAIYEFAILCSNILRKSEYIRLDDDRQGDAERKKANQQYRRIISHTAIQGVYAFVIVGVFRSSINFAIRIYTEPGYLSPEEAEKLQASFGKTLHGKIGVIFIFVTLLCMVNMVLVSKTRDIKDHLGNANLKFLGTRLLLLIAQIQPQVLDAVTKGSALYETLDKHISRKQFPNAHKYFALWTFSKSQAHLAHVCLLNIEGLIVVLVTLLFWRLNDNQKRRLIDYPARRGQVANARERSEDSLMDITMEDGLTSGQYMRLAA